MGALDVIGTQRMFRKGKYKYVFNGADKDQLFDLEQDPYEMNNLAEHLECSDLLKKIKIQFSDWMERNGDPARDGFCKINRIKEWALSEEVNG